MKRLVVCSQYIYYFLCHGGQILTLKSTLNFFRLSICFLWSDGIEGGPEGKKKI